MNIRNLPEKQFALIFKDKLSKTEYSINDSWIIKCVITYLRFFHKNTKLTIKHPEEFLRD